jgi:hypothetical protein
VRPRSVKIEGADITSAREETRILLRAFPKMKLDAALTELGQNTNMVTVMEIEVAVGIGQLTNRRIDMNGEEVEVAAEIEGVRIVANIRHLVQLGMTDMETHGEPNG